MTKLIYFFAVFLTLSLPDSLFAQSTVDTTVTLKQCVEFALRNQPAVRQASIDQEINERDVNIGLSAWLPQLSASNVYQHYFIGSPQAASSNPAAISSGQRIIEYSALGLQANQVIYNADVLQAAKAAKYSRQYYKENTLSSQINVVSDVSKAFFDVLLSKKQRDILNEDIVRLQRSLKDAYNRYQAGIVNKTDYKQATIALNNSIAARKQTAEAINSKFAYLKQIMGISGNHNLTLTFDTTYYEQASYIDTLQKLDVNNRIEYRLLQSRKSLENINVNYYKWSFLPSLSAQGSYNWYFLSHKFTNLFNNSVPSLYAGLSIDLPIFTGTKRLQNLNKAKLQVNRLDLDIENEASAINTEYVQALADYKSSYTNWKLAKQNVELAGDVYKVVTLQYREGIKTYLDVIVVQSQLLTAQINYYNALFNLLSSKIDFEKSLGTLNVQ